MVFSFRNVSHLTPRWPDDEKPSLFTSSHLGKKNVSRGNDLDDAGTSKGAERLYRSAVVKQHAVVKVKFV